ncbi:Os08g0193100, partial [Oryza sativa Japonica Group]
ELLDPLALIKDEVSEISNRLRSMVVAEVPELTLAAGYFFRAGAEGKRTCPTRLVIDVSGSTIDGFIYKHGHG